MASKTYSSFASQHASAASFRPTLPVATLPYVALILIVASFLGAFYFTTLPKQSITAREVIVALVSSMSAGLGTVALFNAVGVHV